MTEFPLESTALYLFLKKSLNSFDNKGYIDDNGRKKLKEKVNH